MIALLPLWVVLSWAAIPILTLAGELAYARGVEGVAKLRPWSSAKGTESKGFASDGGTTHSIQRPAWQGDRTVPGRILFISVGFYGHAMPLLAVAEEMAARGHEVTFGTHICLRSIVDATPGVAFLSAGRMPMHDHQLRAKLRSLSQSGSFWGLLTLLNDVYLPLARPMYRALLAAVSPSPSPLPPRGGTIMGIDAEPSEQKGCGDRSDEERNTHGTDGVSGTGEGTRVLYDDEDKISGAATATGLAFDAGLQSLSGPPHEDVRRCGKSGGIPGEAPSTAAGAGAAGAAVATGRGNCSFTPPFDLAVLDMGSIGGLDFVQKQGIPYLFNSPSVLFDLSGRHVSATLPGWGTGMPRRMSLGERLQNAISPRALSVFLTPPFISMNRARREQGLEPFHAQDDVFHGARILVNTVFGLEYPHDVAPLVEMTGPLLPPRVASALSGRLARHTSRTGAPEQSSGDDSRGGGMGQGGEEASELKDEKEALEGDPLALPFLIRTWLGGTGSLVAPGTAAHEAAVKQATASRQRAEAAAAATTTDHQPKDKQRAEIAAAPPAGTLPRQPDPVGVIYVNLGRMPQLDKWQLLTVLQALSSTSDAVCWGGSGSEDKLGRYRVLWLLLREQREQLLSALLPTAPPPFVRLKVLGGLPHLGILAHPSVKAVVSHCGMAAAQEALLFGKPLLCLPMLVDQQDVSRRVFDAGAGLGLHGLPTGNITAGDIGNAVADIVTDPSYTESARVLSGILRRAGGTLRAADVVEGTLQLGGSSHLHSPEYRAPWYQTTAADAYVLLLAVVIMVAIVGYGLLAALCYGVLLLLRALLRTVLRVVRCMLDFRRYLPRVIGGSRGPSSLQPPPPREQGRAQGSTHGPANGSRASDRAAAAAAAVAGVGLWDEALMTLLGGPGPPEPFPEDYLPELDGPAIDRQPAPGASGRTLGANGSAGGGARRGGSLSARDRGGGDGGGEGVGHLRSLSGELVVWPKTPNGGGAGAHESDVSPHPVTRWD